MAADSTRKTRNFIGIVAIMLIALFYLLEFLGWLSFLDWIILVAAVFVAANILLRRAKKRDL